MGKVTIRDVAKAAGVGLATVSRVVNDDGYVSPSTRERVSVAIKQLGFEPNRPAQALRSGRTRTLGVLVPFFTRYFFLEIIRGIEQACADEDYAIIVYNVEQAARARAHLRSLSSSRRVDGLAVIALDPSLIGRGRFTDGCVGIDTVLPGVPCITFDYDSGMYHAAKHLLELGHQRIAFIDRPADPISSTRSPSRRHGFLRACTEYGVRPERSLLTFSDYSRDGGKRACRRLLSLGESPTAIACASDLQAVGVLEELRSAGLEPGTDVAVSGFHDVELAEYLRLTSVRTFGFEAGVSAARALVAAASGRPQTIQPVPPPMLIVRESTDRR